MPFDGTPEKTLSDAARLLMRAAEIAAKRWRPKVFRHPDGGVCLIGAVAEASEDSRLYVPAEVGDALWDLLPEEWRVGHRGSYLSIGRYSDYCPGLTREKAAELLMQAALRC